MQAVLKKENVLFVMEGKFSGKLIPGGLALLLFRHVVQTSNQQLYIVNHEFSDTWIIVKFNSLIHRLLVPLGTTI